MHELLCILLYLFVIVSPAAYWDYEINDYEEQNQQQVDDIRANEPLKIQIVEDYSADAELITVYDSQASQ